ncbi:MAG: hypothetical protein WCF22_15635 [Candidatus Sulfotelmatobacter sp.]
MSQKPTTPANPAKNETGEFGNFSRLLDKILSVPHSKIKAELDAEKKRTKQPRDRATRGHAYRDVSASD